MLDEPVAQPHARPPAESPSEPLSRNRDFKVLLVSQGISALGDARQLHRAPAARPRADRLGLRDGRRRAPSRRCRILLIGMIAGAIADRSDRKRMMFLADLGRCVLTALIPISVVARRPDDGRHPARGGADQRPSLVLPGRATRPRCRRSSVAARSAARTPTSRPSTRWASSSARPSPGSWPRRSARARRWRSTPLRSGCPRSGLFFVRRDLQGADRSSTRTHDGRDPRGDRLRRSTTRRCAPRSCSGAPPRSCMAPFVTALAVHVTRDLGDEASILGLILVGVRGRDRRRVAGRRPPDAARSRRR